MDQEQIAFVKSLASDVQWGLDQLEISDTPAARRNLLRTLIAAAEGISWVYRLHILAAAKVLEESTPIIELVFAEAGYVVTAHGEIKEQPRFVPLPAMIRLTTNVAQLCCPGLSVDFGTEGWASLKQAIAARNRITHPKNDGDLLLSAKEIEIAKTGFFWFAGMAVDVMEQISGILSEFRDIADKLTAGDPDTLALYERAHRDRDD